VLSVLSASNLWGLFISVYLWINSAVASLRDYRRIVKCFQCNDGDRHLHTIRIEDDWFWVCTWCDPKVFLDDGESWGAQLNLECKSFPLGHIRRVVRLCVDEQTFLATIHNSTSNAHTRLLLLLNESL
jgi:hypothetical protein